MTPQVHNGRGFGPWLAAVMTILISVSGGLPAAVAESVAEAARQVLRDGYGVLAVDEQREICTAETAVTTVEPTGAGLELWFDLGVGGPQRVHRVGTGFQFCTGDNVSFMARSNREVYVMALWRSVTGEPEALDRYRYPTLKAFLQDDRHPGDQRASGTWRLLAADQGLTARKLAALEAFPLPDASGVVLGDDPGLITLVMLVSEKPFDLQEYLDAGTRTVRSSEPGKAGDTGSKDPLQAFNELLDTWARNTVVHYAEGPERDSFAFVIDRASPALLEITLRHSGCERRSSLPRLD